MYFAQFVQKYSKFFPQFYTISFILQIFPPIFLHNFFTIFCIIFLHNFYTIFFTMFCTICSNSAEVAAPYFNLPLILFFISYFYVKKTEFSLLKGVIVEIFLPFEIIILGLPLFIINNSIKMGFILKNCNFFKDQC